MPGTVSVRRHARRGFVIGELLVAVLLLAVAVSSLAALMYSISHRAAEPDRSECVAKAQGNSKCVSKPAVASGASKLLRSTNKSTCEGMTGAAARDCVDAAIAHGGETVVVPKTDSASLALIPKKEKRPIRTDRGFIR
ncbi:MAG TPA: hypothetical protein VM166_15690 [Gemmatimonadaceae bacterium]|nr:hypothetical protein [Gemmatimonadaceae bacterium]